MLSAQCPNCSAPIRFAHAAAPVVICPNCDSTVTRDNEDLAQVGTVSSVSRDLSVFLLETRGSYKDRSFEIVGVLRKEMNGIRWNEWFLVFDDGDKAWLAEANGELQLYDTPPLTDGFPTEAKLGDRFAANDIGWKVTEQSSVRIIAASGALPYPVVQNQENSYLDLRTEELGIVGTIDFEDDPATLWIGKIIQFSELNMEGVRPFAGWSDEVDVNFHGLEINSTRSVECPSCSAPLSIRAPGDTQVIGCQYCGATIGVEEQGDSSALRLIDDVNKELSNYEIPLGSRIKQENQLWECIGGMTRSVTIEGERYFWKEYCFRNPYVGYRWLVHSDNSWSWVQSIHGVPKGIKKNTVQWEATSYHLFQKAQIDVVHVVGEFYWQVSVGDTVQGLDYIAPPMMLSREKSNKEISWSIAQWKSHEEIRSAFVKLPDNADELFFHAFSPIEPNPFSDGKLIRRGLLAAVFFFFLLVCSGMAAIVVPANETLTKQTFISKDEAQDTEIFLSETFEVPAKRNSLSVTVQTPGAYSSPVTVHTALLNKDKGNVYIIDVGKMGTSEIPKVEPGTYVIRVEHAKNPKRAKAQKNVQTTTTVTVVRDEIRFPSLICLAFVGLIFAPILWTMRRSSIETKRWHESNIYAGDY